MEIDYIGFERWLVRLGREDRTIERHFTNLKVLSRELKSWSVKNTDCLLLNLKKTRSNATLNSYVDTIRLYSTFANLSQKLQKTPHFRVEKTNKTTLSCEELEKLYNLPCPQGADPRIWYKDEFFIKLCCLTGARPGEIAGLTKYDFENGYIKINKTKTHEPRLIPIPATITEETKTYLNKLGGDKLFVTSKGYDYSYACWNHMFKKRLQMAGIDKPGVNLYTLRHSMATELYRRKNNPLIISKLLGNSVEMVEKTYSHMVIDDVIQALNTHPLIRGHTDPKELIKQLNKMIREFKIEDDKRFTYTVVETEKGIEFKAQVLEPVPANP